MSKKKMTISFRICEKCWDDIENGFAIYGSIEGTNYKSSSEGCIDIICEHKKKY